MNLNQYREELKLRFREKVRPFAQEVATRKGFSIVIPKNEGLLLSVDPGNDITNDVIVAFQSAGQKPAAAPAPAKAAGEEAAAPVKKKSEEKKTAAATREKSKSKDKDGETN